MRAYWIFALILFYLSSQSVYAAVAWTQCGPGEYCNERQCGSGALSPCVCRDVDNDPLTADAAWVYRTTPGPFPTGTMICPPSGLNAGDGKCYYGSSSQESGESCNEAVGVCNSCTPTAGQTCNPIAGCVAPSSCTITLAANPSTAPADGTPITLTASAVDNNDNPINGLSVNFNKQDSSAPGTFTPSSCTTISGGSSFGSCSVDIRSSSGFGGPSTVVFASATGCTSDSETVTFTSTTPVDTTPPTVSNLQYTTPCRNLGTYIQATASDNVALNNCVFKDNGVSSPMSIFSCMAGTCAGRNHVFTTTGSHTTEVECFDTSNNPGSTGITNIVVQDETQPPCTTEPPPPILTCSIPSDLSCSATSNEITFSWSPVSGATEYTAIRCDDAGSNCDAGFTTATTSRTYTGLTPSTSYTFKSRVSSSDGTCTVPSSDSQTLCTTNPLVVIPPPTISLTANPPSVKSGESTTLSWFTYDATSCTASGAWSGSKSISGSESVTPNPNSLTPVVYTLTCSGPGGSSSQSLPVPVLCKTDISISSTPPLDAGKSSVIMASSQTWIVDITASSSVQCPNPETYTLTNMITSGTCNVETGVYDGATPLSKLSSSQSSGTRNLADAFVSAARTGLTADAFRVRVDRLGDSCTLAFIIKSADGTTVDPSFTVTPDPNARQPPHISFFDYSGTVELFNSQWKAFYPDNFATRDMNVKCGLNCDPASTDCSPAGIGCMPYDASQGPAILKEGDCDVTDPTYNFGSPNEINCLFYDPADTSLDTPVTFTFVPIDFEISGSDRISAGQGELVETKIDLTNTGLIQDSYTVTVTSNLAAVEITTPSQRTESTLSTQTIPVSFGVRPLSSSSNIVTVTVTSNTAPSVSKTFDIELGSGNFALPEFGFIGLVQIIVLAGIAYFILLKNEVRKSGKRSRRKR